MFKRKARAEKVSLTLTSEMSLQLKKEVKKIKEKQPSSNPTIMSVMRQFIISNLKRLPQTKTERKRSNQFILNESNNFKIQGLKKMQTATLNSLDEGKSMLLLAAARELEALAMLQTCDDDVIKTTIIETLVLLKLATGYKKLPEFPYDNKTVQFMN